MAALNQDLNTSLRGEKAWVEVAGGLGKVLLGYAIFTVGYLIAGGFLYTALMPVINNKGMKLEHLWMFYIGIALLKITNLLSWGMIIAGQWRCLMNSPERHGAKWIIFFCMTCVVMGPVLHMLAWFGGLSTPIRWTGGPAAFASVKLKFTMMGLFLMSASLITAVLYKLSFWYFLQTVAGCMGAPKTKVCTSLFFVFFLGACGFTYYVLFSGLHQNRMNDLIPFLGVAWLGVWLYWVAMIVVVKSTIGQTMELVRNPLLTDDPQPQYQLAGS